MIIFSSSHQSQSLIENNRKTINDLKIRNLNADRFLENIRVIFTNSHVYFEFMFRSNFNFEYKQMESREISRWEVSFVYNRSKHVSYIMLPITRSDNSQHNEYFWQIGQWIFVNLSTSKGGMKEVFLIMHYK